MFQTNILENATEQILSRFVLIASSSGNWSKLVHFPHNPISNIFLKRISYISERMLTKFNFLIPPYTPEWMLAKGKKKILII